MNTIEGYIILNKNIKKISTKFILLTILLMIFLIVISTKEYTLYYDTISKTTKINNEYNLIVYTNINNLNIVTNNNKLKIDDNNYIYNIKSINIINVNNIEVIINVKNFKDINNNIKKVKFIKSKKKIYYYIISIIKGSD